MLLSEINPENLKTVEDLQQAIIKLTMVRLSFVI